MKCEDNGNNNLMHFAEDADKSCQLSWYYTLTAPSTGGVQTTVVVTSLHFAPLFDFGPEEAANITTRRALP
jgi:hypothetical protein